MVERRICSFCGREIEFGTGRLYILKDGTTYQFCRTKCFKNLIQLRRVPRRTRWTATYEREKAIRLRGLRPAEEEARPAPARRAAKAPKKAVPKAPEAEEAIIAEAEEAAAPAVEEAPAIEAEEKPRKRRARKVAKPAATKPSEKRKGKAPKEESS